VAEAVKCLPSKHGTPSSDPNTAKKEKEKKFLAIIIVLIVLQNQLFFPIIVEQESQCSSY
jgi:hypothetical protein